MMNKFCFAFTSVLLLALYLPYPTVADPPVAPPSAPTSKPLPPTHRHNPQRTYQFDDLHQEYVRINGHTFHLWVMDTAGKREEGMMFLTDPDVGSDEGMIFVFPQAQEMGFWMKNTLIPLDVAFIGSDKHILNLEQMQPQDETLTNSQGEALYVIEVKQGVFEKLGIQPAMQVRIPESIKSKD